MVKLTYPVGSATNIPVKCVSYDIENSWVHGLKYCGYIDVYNEIQGVSKQQRMEIVRRYEKTKYPNILNDMRKYWMLCLRTFMLNNRIKDTEYVAHFYDAIYLNTNRQMKTKIFIRGIGNINFRKEYEEVPLSKIKDHIRTGCK